MYPYVILAVIAIVSCVFAARRRFPGWLFGAMIAVLASACGGPEPTGSTGAGIVWKDATGKVTEGVSGEPGGVVFFVDERGYFWRVDPETASVSVFDAPGSAFGTWPAFTSPDCTGPSYLISGTVPPTFPEPRITFMGPDSPAIHVRPDALPDTMISWCSSLTSSGCKPYAMGCAMERALPTASLLPSPPLMVPVLTYTAPLHPDAAP